jgi:hypothetical protein
MKRGQTLVIFLVFIVMSITVISAAVAILVTNTIGSSRTEQSRMAYTIAEGGMENALMRLLRNPAYLGEILPVGSGQATITLTPTDPIIVTSVGVQGSFSRKIQTTVSFADDGSMQVSAWQEI